jgi:hypothetical protein
MPRFHALPAGRLNTQNCDLFFRDLGLRFENAVTHLKDSGSAQIHQKRGPSGNVGSDGQAAS